MPARKTSTVSTRLIRHKPYKSMCVILRDVDLDGFNESTIKNAEKVLQKETKRLFKPKPRKRPKLAPIEENVKEPIRLMEEFQKAEDFELCVVRHRPDTYVCDGKLSKESPPNEPAYFLKDPKFSPTPLTPPRPLYIERTPQHQTYPENQENNANNANRLSILMIRSRVHSFRLDPMSQCKMLVFKQHTKFLKIRLFQAFNQANNSTAFEKTKNNRKTVTFCNKNNDKELLESSCVSLSQFIDPQNSSQNELSVEFQSSLYDDSTPKSITQTQSRFDTAIEMTENSELQTAIQDDTVLADQNLTQNTTKNKSTRRFDLTKAGQRTVTFREEPSIRTRSTRKISALQQSQANVDQTTEDDLESTLQNVTTRRTRSRNNTAIEPTTLIAEPETSNKHGQQLESPNDLLLENQNRPTTRSLGRSFGRTKLKPAKSGRKTVAFDNENIRPSTSSIQVKPIIPENASNSTAIEVDSTTGSKATKVNDEQFTLGPLFESHVEDQVNSTRQSRRTRSRAKLETTKVNTEQFTLGPLFESHVEDQIDEQATTNLTQNESTIKNEHPQQRDDQQFTLGSLLNTQADDQIGDQLDESESALRRENLATLERTAIQSDSTVQSVHRPRTRSRAVLENPIINQNSTKSSKARTKARNTTQLSTNFETQIDATNRKTLNNALHSIADHETGESTLSSNEKSSNARTRSQLKTQGTTSTNFETQTDATSRKTLDNALFSITSHETAAKSMFRSRNTTHFTGANQKTEFDNALLSISSHDASATKAQQSIHDDTTLHSTRFNAQTTRNSNMFMDPTLDDIHLSIDPNFLEESSFDNEMPIGDDSGCANELENTLCDDYEPLEQLLKICKQTEVMPFSQLLDANAATKKLGEGSYGEVFATQLDGVDVALKIVPFTLDDELRSINGDFMKTASAIMPEAIISQQLSRLSTNQVNKESEAISILLQIITSLQIAEKVLEFEHRDLHIGNVLINRVDANQEIEYCSENNKFKLNSNGVVATIIDFTNSRINKDGLTIFLDLASDTELFEGPSDEYQFEIYREMKRVNNNNWHVFTPRTNCFWIHYLSKKLLLLKSMRIKRRREVQDVFDLLLGCDNLDEFMQLDDVTNLFEPYRAR
ncbi:Non-specific serine/threonine protein kinase [Aphelenchoides bicaudatus]|nr:Non-specific serine/threonine protein kinase [Aphelenchoides bicaudatus]